MGNRVGTVHVRRQRGKLVVQGTSKTPRGTRFILNSAPIAAATMASPEFKEELMTAVEKVVGTTQPNLPFRAGIDDNRR